MYGNTILQYVEKTGQVSDVDIFIGERDSIIIRLILQNLLRIYIYSSNPDPVPGSFLG
jgi:hypothetical protein